MSSYRRKRPLGSVQREMLEELTAGDMLYGFLLSARSTKLMYKYARERAMRRQMRERALKGLIEGKYVIKRGDIVSITSTGREVCEKAIKRTRHSLATRRWDGKWRIIIYDIPEELRTLRYELRDILKRAGFRMLQQSVWVFPHECRELLDLLKRERKNLARLVLYATVEEIEQGERIRQEFGVKGEI